MVVDAEIDEGVGEPGIARVLLDHEQGRRLLASLVSSRRLGGGEAVEEPLGERLPGRRLECLRERVDGGGGDEDVPLRGEARAGASAGPVVAPRAGVGGCAARAVDDPELALVAALVRVGQSRDRVLGGQAFTQEPSPSGP